MEQPEHGGAPFEHLEQAVAGLHVRPAGVAEQPRRAADVELGRGRYDIGEDRSQRPEERPLADREARILERAAHDGRARTLADDRLVEVGARPVDEPGVGLVLQLEDPLRDAPRDAVITTTITTRG